METIYTSVDQLIGHTPLLQLPHENVRLLAKLESFNPGGSAKDRVAKAMLDDAQKKGLVDRNTVIIEPTSGNTGIGLCAVAAARGLRCVIVMPASMSMERRMLMAAYGAEVVLSPAEKGMPGAIEMANDLARQYPKSFIPGQFDNPANPQAHYDTTGPEIWEDCDGNVDIFVAGVGTGGTVTGAGRFLKEKNPKIRIVGAEPDSSAVLSGEKAGKHGIQGIGAGFVPSVLDMSVIDEIIRVTDEDAFACARDMGAKSGVLVGISSGAALKAAMEVAARPENRGKTIVVLLPDSGERYLSTALYQGP